MKPQSKVGIAILLFVAVIVCSGIAVVWSVNAYHARHRHEHLDRLQHIQATHPTDEQLRKMLGTPWKELPTDEAVTFARNNWGGPSFSISPDTSRRSTRTFIFLFGDMVYLVFLDSTGSM